MGGVGHQVGLELSDIDVEGTVESEGGSEGRDNLGNESVQVGVGGSLDIEVAAADIVDGLVVEHDSDVGGDLGGWVDGEAELGLLAVVDGESLEEEGAETGAGTATNSVEDEEALETSALIGELTDAVEAEINNLLTNGVVATGEVVGGVLLAGDELLGVEELSVGASADLIDDGGLEIEEDAAGHVLAGTSLGEEGVEGIITATDGLVRGHLTVGLNTVLKAEELPAGVTDLDTGLTDVDGNDFSHCDGECLG